MNDQSMWRGARCVYKIESKFRSIELPSRRSESHIQLTYLLLAWRTYQSLTINHPNNIAGIYYIIQECKKQSRKKTWSGERCSEEKNKPSKRSWVVGLTHLCSAWQNELVTGKHTTLSVQQQTIINLLLSWLFLINTVVASCWHWFCKQGLSEAFTRRTVWLFFSFAASSCQYNYNNHERTTTCPLSTSTLLDNKWRATWYDTTTTQTTTNSHTLYILLCSSSQLFIMRVTLCLYYYLCMASLCMVIIYNY